MRSQYQWLGVVGLMFLTACNGQGATNAEDSKVERNVQNTKDFFELVLNQGQYDLIDEMMADGYTLQGKPFPAHKTRAWAEFIRKVHPTGKFHLRHVFGSGDHVAVWWVYDTESLDIGPGINSGINILTMREDGKVISNWEGDLATSTIPRPTPHAGLGALPIPEEAYRDNNGFEIDGYDGEKFVLRHDYPTQVPPDNSAAWNNSISWPMTDANVVPYMMALRDHAYDALRPVDWRIEKIDVGENGAGGWYHAPWNAGIYGTDDMGDGIPTWCGRDFLRGLYFGTPLPRGTIPQQTLQASNYEVVYYNDLGGYHLGQVWNQDGTPNEDVSYAMPDGTMIVKLVFTSVKDNVHVLDGTEKWPAFLPSEPNCAKPAMTDVKLIQLDIVVKDSQHSPDTGWIFTTFVYDKDHPSDDPWERMVPLGAMWGDDPGVWPGGELKETVLNPDMPDWFTLNLGYGGRLSGPIDGARNDGSCLSCHSTAEFSLEEGVSLLGHMIPPADATIEENMDYYFKNIPGDVAWTTANKALAKPLQVVPKNPIPLDYSFVTLNGLAHYHSVAGNNPAKGTLGDRSRYQGGGASAEE